MIEKERHKELHKKIFNCKCLPISPGSKYCENCQTAVIEFMNEYGAGVLTNDMVIEELKHKISKLVNENISLNNKFKDIVQKYDKLKASLVK